MPTETGLPPGLVLNRSTGEVLGTPADEGAGITYEFTLLLRDAIGTTREIAEAITVFPYVQMSADDIPVRLTVGTAYSYLPNVQDGVSPYLYAIPVGTLPPGLSFNAGTGEISGTPTSDGGPSDDYLITYTVTDAKAQEYARAAIFAVRTPPVVSSDDPPGATVGSAFSWTPDVSGGHLPYSYTVTGILPAGITHSDGTFSGTPTEAGTAIGITFRATDAAGNYDQEVLTFNVYEPPVLSGTLAKGVIGVAYSQSFGITGGAPPLAYSHLGAIPAGLSLNAATGVLSGTPTTSADSNLTIVVTDALNNIDTRAQTVSVRAPLVLAGDIDDGQYNIAYSDGIAATGGYPPYTYSIPVGTLPSGFSINPSTGIISGTTAVDDTYNFTIRATDADGQTDDQAVELIIAGELTVSGDLTGTATTTVAYSDSLTGLGGTPPYTVTKLSGTLPTSLSLSSAGVLSGTPTAAGTYNFTVRVTDSVGAFSDRAESIVVAAFPVLSGTLPDKTRSTAYSASYSLAGGHTPIAYTISAGTLPTGLTINASTGAITGTPTVAGASTFTVRAEDAQGNVATRAGTVTIYAPVSLTNNYAANGYVGVAYSGSAPTVAGGKTPITFSQVGGTLPAGLSLNASTGAITGTPTTATSYSFTIRATDALGDIEDIAHSVTVVSAPSMTNLASAPKATDGKAYSFTITGTGGVAPYTFSGTLGKGLSLSSAGVVSGTAAHSGATASTGYSVTITDSNGQSATSTLTISFADMPQIFAPTADELRATRGVAFSKAFTAVYGHTPRTFSKYSGTLPSGLSLSSSGTLSGTTTAAAATYTFVARVSDAEGNTDNTSTQSLVLANAMTLTGSYPRGTVGQAYSSSALALAGGHSGYTWSKYSGTLPSGLSLNASTGALTGTPTAPGTYVFVIRVTDDTGQTVNSSSQSVTIASQVVLSGVMADGTEDAPYSSSFTISGGWTPYSYAKTAGTLPTGTSLNASTGVLSGTPTTPGDYTFTLTVTDADGDTDTQADTVTIAAATSALSVSISPNPISEHKISSGGTAQVVSKSGTATGAGGAGGYSYSWTYVSGDVLSTSGAGTATCTFSTTILPGVVKTAVYRCTVTDGDSDTAFEDVDVTLRHSNLA